MAILVCFFSYLWVNRYEYHVQGIGRSDFKVTIKENTITGYRCTLKENDPLGRTDLRDLKKVGEKERKFYNFPEWCSNPSNSFLGISGG